MASILSYVFHSCSDTPTDQRLLSYSFMIDFRSELNKKLVEEDRTQIPEVMDTQVDYKGLSPMTEGDMYEAPSLRMFG